MRTTTTLMVVAMLALAGCTRSDAPAREDDARGVGGAPARDPTKERPTPLERDVARAGPETRTLEGVRPNATISDACGWGYTLANATPEDGRHLYTDNSSIADAMWELLADDNLTASLTYALTYTRGCMGATCTWRMPGIGDDFDQWCDNPGGWVLLRVANVTNRTEAST